MHNREITFIVKTDILSINQLVVKTKCSFCCHLRETYVKKRINVFYETTMQKLDLRLYKDSNYLIISLCFEFIGEFMTLNQKDPMLFWIFFYKLYSPTKKV